MVCFWISLLILMWCWKKNVLLDISPEWSEMLKHLYIKCLIIFIYYKVLTCHSLSSYMKISIILNFCSLEPTGFISWWLKRYLITNQDECQSYVLIFKNSEKNCQSKYLTLVVPAVVHHRDLAYLRTVTL